MLLAIATFCGNDRGLNEIMLGEQIKRLLHAQCARLNSIGGTHTGPKELYCLSQDRGVSVLPDIQIIATDDIDIDADR